MNLSEQYFLSVKKGTPVELKSNIFPDRTFNGMVNIVYPTIDPASRTFTVEVKIPNKDEALRPGMYGTINFFIGETETVVVPALAVLKLQGANNRYVFLNKEGKAKRVDVTCLLYTSIEFSPDAVNRTFFDNPREDFVAFTTILEFKNFIVGFPGHNFQASHFVIVDNLG